MDKVAAAANINIIRTQTGNHIVDAIAKRDDVIATIAEVNGFDTLQGTVGKEYRFTFIAQYRVSTV